MATVALTQKEFIRRCKEVHGTTYSYKNVVYTTTKNKVVITCKVHGNFEQKAAKHLQGHGCKKCAYEAHSKHMSGSRTEERDFLLQLRLPKLHKYLGPFVNLATRVELFCPKHGHYWKRPSELLKGKFCPDCSRNRLTTEAFAIEARKVHGQKYDYSKVIYKKVTGKVLIICPEHGEFKQSHSAHINQGKGCPRCVTKRYSKKAIKWLEYEAKKRRLKNVLHAENGGEFYIKELRCYADGYHKRSNTVFEFYGDAYHGNIKRYPKDAYPNPYSDLTTVDLYRKTMLREKQLRRLGYNIVSIWESDFNLILRSTKCQSRR